MFPTGRRLDRDFYDAVEDHEQAIGDCTFIKDPLARRNFPGF